MAYKSIGKIMKIEKNYIKKECVCFVCKSSSLEKGLNP